MPSIAHTCRWTVSAAVALALSACSRAPLGAPIRGDVPDSATISTDAARTPASNGPAPNSGVNDQPVGALKPSHTAIAASQVGNPYVASVREPGHPERRSLMHQAKPFDPVAYAKDPERYLHTIEPSRVHQSVAPGPGVPALRPLGGIPPALASGGTQVLTAQAVPNAPVSWHCLEGGVFEESTLNSITVAADAQGVARVTYIANFGTVGDSLVVAASPLCAGQLQFFLHVNERP